MPTLQLWPLSFLLLLITGCSALVNAGESQGLSEQIAQVAKQFEAEQDHAFKSSGASLDVWRHGKHAAAVKSLKVLLANATGPDRLFCAYQLLLVEPDNHNARTAFPLGKAPIDAKGARVEGLPIPTSTNLSLLMQVSNLLNPSISEVAALVGRRSVYVQAYWQSLVFGYDDLRKKMLKFADQGDTEGALQTLAYYWPECREVKRYYSQIGKPIPRQRTWFTCVDRYLIDHELATVDCLDSKLFRPATGTGPVMDVSGSQFDGKSSWEFMEKMRNCRIEAIVTSKQPSTLSLCDDHGNGAEIVIDGKNLSLHSLDNGSATVVQDVQRAIDATKVPSLLFLEIRGRKVTVFEAGSILATTELPHDVAYARIAVNASGMTAQLLRVRFLSDHSDEQDRETAVAVHKAPPVALVVEPWVAQRNAQLEKPVTFRFEDTSVEEVIALFAQLTGVTFTFDPGAEPLKNVPVTFSGKNMRLSSALDWLKRVSDLSAVPTANGMMLTWKK